MSHVHHQHGAHFIGHLPEFLEIYGSGICGGSGDDHSGLCLQRDPAQFVIVDKALCVDAVGHDVEVFSRHVHRAAMGQMSAMVQVHAHDGIPGLAYRELHRHIGLGPGMRLHIGVVTAEEFLGPVDGQILHHVHTVAAAIVSLAGIPFRVFVGQRTAHGGHHGLTHPVLGRDQFNVAVLSVLFVHDRLRDFRIHVLYFIKRIHISYPPIHKQSLFTLLR